jgi:hypothetical protein
MQATWALAIAMGLGLAITFSVWTSSSWHAFPRFLVALVFLFILPGSQFVRWCRLQVSPLEHLTLSVVLGMIGVCLLYAVLVWLDVAALFYLWIIAAAIGLGRMWRSVAMDIRDRLLAADRTHFLLLLAMIASWLPMCALPFYYPNISLSSDGGLIFLPQVHDVFLHTSLASELTHTFPPQTPFLAGQPLSYHVGMDLVAAVFHRYGGLAISDLVVRFCPTLFITIDVLAVFCLARRFALPGAAAVAAAVLATLGEDFSFIPGILQKSTSIWSIQYFGAPTVFSLYFVNPMVVGHGLLFTSLFCLQRSIANHHWGWIVATSFCSAALVETKIFAFIQLFMALWIVLAANLVVTRQWIFLRQCVAISLMGLPLILLTSLANRNGAQIVWMWSSGLENYVQTAFKASDWPLFVTFPVTGLVVYLAMTYGFRIIGIGELIKAFSPTRADGFHLLLAVFVVLGPILSLTTKVVPRDDPTAYNNAIWFIAESKYVMTLFAVLALTRVWKRLDWTGRSLMTAAVTVMSFTSTIQHFYELSSYPAIELTPPAMQAVGFLNRETRPGQIVMSRLNEAILSLTALRVPFYYLAEVARSDVYATRRKDIDDFWQSWMGGMVREDLLTKYGIDWIVASRSETPATLGDTPLTIHGKLEIERRFTNDQFIAYQVRAAER